MLSAGQVLDTSLTYDENWETINQFIGNLNSKELWAT